MITFAKALNKIVPITQFNKGKASQIFSRLKTEHQLIVVKNNLPSAVILSPEEFERLSEIEENYQLLMEAQSRMSEESMKNTISFETVMKNLNITSEALENEEDVEIE